MAFSSRHVSMRHINHNHNHYSIVAFFFVADVLLSNASHQNYLTLPQHKTSIVCFNKEQSNSADVSQTNKCMCKTLGCFGGEEGMVTGNENFRFHSHVLCF